MMTFTDDKMPQEKTEKPSKITVSEGPERDLSCGYCHDTIPDNPRYVGKDKLAYHNDCAIEHLQTFKAPESALEKVLNHGYGFASGLGAQVVLGDLASATHAGALFVPLMHFLRGPHRDSSTHKYVTDGAGFLAGVAVGEYIKTLLR